MTLLLKAGRATELSVLDHIFVPLDGSKRAESVLPYVEILSQKSFGKVTLFHTVEPAIPVTSKAYAGLVSKAVQMAKRRADEYLESIAARLKTRKIEADVKVAVGEAAPQILTTGDRLGQTMIALSGFSLADEPNKSFGTVADHVLHYNRTPTLLVRPGENMEDRVSFKTIVVPLDGSTVAEKALDVANKLAQLLGCRLKLIQVTPTRQQLFAQMGFDVAKSMTAAASLEDPLNNEGEAYLIKQVSRLRSTALKIDYEIANGPIVDAILNRARSAEKPLVVFCTAGSKGDRYRWRMGSVAKGLVRSCNIPIIAVPHSYTSTS